MDDYFLKLKIKNELDELSLPYKIDIRFLPKTGSGNLYDWNRISHRYWMATARVAGLSKAVVEVLR